jgi:hypothetical protein
MAYEAYEVNQLIVPPFLGLLTMPLTLSGARTRVHETASTSPQDNPPRATLPYNTCIKSYISYLNCSDILGLQRRHDGLMPSL